MEIPKPSGILYRKIRVLSNGEENGTYLCLPRRLDNSLDHESYNDEVQVNASHRNIHHMLKKGRASGHGCEHLALLPQLFIVKMSTKAGALRKEFNILNELHHGYNSDGSETFIGSFPLRAQFTGENDTTWLVFRPIFGRILQQFGTLCIDASHPIPSYFVWHVFLGLVSALEFIHDRGITHGDIRPAHIMLNQYPPRNPHHYRDYPDVVLIGFRSAGNSDVTGVPNDIKGLLTTMGEAIIQWSDVATLPKNLSLTSMLMPLAVFERELRDMLKQEEELNLEAVKEKWGGVAVAQRDLGPAKISSLMFRWAHDDLATETELDKARQPATILRQFGRRVGAFRQFVANPQDLVRVRQGMNGEWGHFVIKFKGRKADFVNLVGGDDGMDLN